MRWRQGKWFEDRSMTRNLMESMAGEYEALKIRFEAIIT